MSGQPPDAAAAVRNAHAWFEHNSGWAPPDPETLDEWVADGVCRCPDECLVAPRAWCEHGLASWLLVLEALDELDRAGPVPSGPSSGAGRPDSPGVGPRGTVGRGRSRSERGSA